MIGSPSCPSRVGPAPALRRASRRRAATLLSTFPLRQHHSRRPLRAGHDVPEAEHGELGRSRVSGRRRRRPAVEVGQLQERGTAERLLRGVRLPDSGLLRRDAAPTPPEGRKSRRHLAFLASSTSTSGCVVFLHFLCCCSKCVTSSQSKHLSFVGAGLCLLSECESVRGAPGTSKSADWTTRTFIVVHVVSATSPRPPKL